MRTVGKIAKAALLAALLAGCASAPVVEDEERLRAGRAVALFDEAGAAQAWYGVYFQGHKVGYMSVLRERHAAYLQLETAIHTQSQGMGRASASLWTLTERFDPRPPHDLVLLEQRDGEGEFASVARIERRAEGYVGIHSENGRQSTRPLFDFRYRLADALAPQMWVRGDPDVGACLTYPTHDLDAMRRSWISECVARRFTRTVEGAPVDAVDLLFGQQGAMLRMVRDTGGRVLLTQHGSDFEMRLESRELATDLEAPFDFFLDNMVRVDRPLGEAGRIRRLTLDLVGLDGLGPGAAPGQVVERVDDGAALRVTVDRAAALADDAPPNPAALASALALSDSQRLNLPRLSALADHATAGAASDGERLRRLVAFVHGYIEADFSSEPVSLSRLLDQRRGDCTEYSQLLDALLRVSGIPTREVNGLIYAGDEAQSFAHHAWNEAWVDGRWLPVDASWNEVPVNATHVRYPLGEARFAAVLQAMSGALIRVVDVEYLDP